MAVVDLRHVHRTLGKGNNAVPVLRDVTLSVARNEMVAIVGPSGSGKSTLMNIIGLLDRPTSGTVRVADQGIEGMSNDRMAVLRGQAIGFVFQSYNLLPRNSAIENVELPLVYAGSGRRERRWAAAEALRAVGLLDKAHHRPSQLSGGEQQRVAIARAIVRRPPLLLADEPTGALDSATGARVLALFHDLHSAGLTVVLITHDPQVAGRCERIVRLRDGRVD